MTNCSFKIIRFFCLALAPVAAAVSCASSQTTLANKLVATTNYYKSSHLEKCHQGAADSPRCKPCEAIINTAGTRADTANTNAKIGYMPPAEVTEINATLDSLATCP